MVFGGPKCFYTLDQPNLSSTHAWELELLHEEDGRQIACRVIPERWKQLLEYDSKKKLKSCHKIPNTTAFLLAGIMEFSKFRVMPDEFPFLAVN